MYSITLHVYLGNVAKNSCKCSSNIVCKCYVEVVVTQNLLLTTKVPLHAHLNNNTKGATHIHSYMIVFIEKSIYFLKKFYFCMER